MRRNREKVDAELNLLPIMNLFVALIPFLLVGTAFFHLTVLNVSVPTNTDDLVLEDPVKKKKNVKVTMTVQVTNEGFKLFGMCEDLELKDLNELTKTIRKRKNKYRYRRLTTFLHNVKKIYRKSDTVVVVPDKNIPYDTVIKVIDAARKKTFGSKDKFLFTNVVVSSKV